MAWSGLSPGDPMTVAAQVNTAVATSGRYTFSLRIRKDYATPIDHTVTGFVFVVARDASAYGAGWWFSLQDQLIDIPTGGGYPAGQLRVLGSGGWRFYEGTSGTLTGPADDPGAMVKNADNTFTYTNLWNRKWNFDTSGKLTTIVSGDGQETITFTYSGSDVSKITSPDGGVATFTYASGKLSTIETPGSRTTTFTVSSGQLTQIEDPDARTHTFTYAASTDLISGESRGTVRKTYAYTYGAASAITEGSGDPMDLTPQLTVGLASIGGGTLRATVEDPRNYKTRWRLDGSGRPLERIAADGGVWTMERNNAGYLTKATDPGNRVTTIAVDSSGMPTTITYATGDSKSYVYGGIYHQVSKITDERGYITTVTYDAQGHVETVKNALSETTTYTYSSGLLQTIVDPLGQKTTYLYDTRRRLETVIDPLGNRTTSTYDLKGFLETTKDPLGNVTTYVHDAMGRLTETIDAKGKRTTHTYNSSGLLYETVDPLNDKTRNTYDNRGLIEKEIHAYGSAVENSDVFAYDGAGLMTLQTDPNGFASIYPYDPEGRQIAATDAAGLVSQSRYNTTGWQTEQIDAVGRATVFSYDDLGRQTKVTDPLGNVSTSVYDAAGNRTASIDQLGRRTTTVYDATNRQTQVQDALGYRSTTVYDAAGNVSKTIDALNYTTTYLYDADNRQTGMIDALGNRSTTVYDAAGNVSKTIDALNRTTTYLYDSLNRQTEVIDALGYRSTTVYDDAGNVSKTVDALNYTTTYLYDALNRRTTVIDALGNRATTVYDGAGQVSASIDQLGRVNETFHDGLGRVVETRNALGNSYQSQYDNAGNLEASIDALGNRTSYVYDALNRQTAMIDALGNRATTVYDAASQVTATINERGYRVTYTYDNLGKQTEVQDSLGNSTTTVYDAAGQVSATIDALGNRTTYTLDAVGRQTEIRDALGNRTTTVYDAVGNVVNTIDPLNHKSTFVYDAVNQKTQSIDALAGKTTMVYDAVGQLVNLIDPVGNKTTFVYDGLGRQTKEIDSLGKTITMVYDAASQLTSRIDRLGRTREFTYDAAGRNTKEAWIESSSTVNTITLTYDANSNLLTAADGDGTYTYTYDALNSVATVKDMWNTTLTFTYDGVGNRTKVEDSFGGIATSTYNGANNLTKREFGGPSQTPLRTDFTYTNRHEQATATRYSDLAGNTKIGSTTYTYDALGRMTRLEHRNGNGNHIANYTYTYDAASRLTSEILNGTTTSYTYDNTDQLTNDSLTTFSYDANGNRNMTGYQTGTGNRMTNDGVYTYTYDAEGNLTKKSKGLLLETWTYAYDHRNMLIWAEKRSTDGGVLQMRADYKYDALRNRIEKAVDADGAGVGGTVTTRFALVDTFAVGRYYSASSRDNSTLHVWAALDGSSSLTTRYVYGDEVDQLLARITSGGSVNWYLADRLGNVRDITDGSGAVVNHIDYDGFGKVTSESSPGTGDVFRFTSAMLDSETGWMHLRDRLYMPDVGRFNREDTIRLAGDFSHLFRYVHNSPTNATDPSGLKDVPELNRDRDKPSQGLTNGQLATIGIIVVGVTVCPPALLLLVAGCGSPTTGSAPVTPTTTSIDGQTEVRRAFSAFLGWNEARELYESTRNALGGTLHVQASTRHDVHGWWAPRENTVYVNPTRSNTHFLRVGTILMEVLNASATTTLDGISTRSTNGLLSRIDYVVAVEKVEYDNAKKHHEIASGAVKANIWGNDAVRYKPPLIDSFDFYLNVQIDAGHAKRYGNQWDRNSKRAWLKKNNERDQDVPVEAVTKGLKKATLEALREALQSD